MDWHPVQGGLEILLTTSRYRNRDKLRQLWASRLWGFSFYFFYTWWLLYIYKKDTLDTYEFLTAHTQKEKNNTNYMYYVILITAGATV